VGTFGVEVEVDLLTLGNIWWSDIQKLWRVVTVVGPHALSLGRALNTPMVLVITNTHGEVEPVSINWIRVSTWQVVTIEEADINTHELSDRWHNVTESTIKVVRFHLVIA
jgi:hypothetical protein